MEQEKVTKCPACGAFRSSFSAVCPDCGYEFSTVETSQSLQDFSNKIEQYDREIFENETSSSATGAGTIVLWVLLFPVMLGIFVFKKIQAKHEVLTGVEKMKSEAILNFPIPNSRNDLTEFAILVENHIKPINYFSALTKSGANVQKWNRIWAEKSKQIEKKATIALDSDKAALRQIQKSIAAVQQQNAANEKTQWIAIGILAAIFVIFMIIAIIVK